jgi:hypothetical protein
LNFLFDFDLPRVARQKTKFKRKMAPVKGAATKATSKGGGTPQLKIRHVDASGHAEYIDNLRT